MVEKLLDRRSACLVARTTWELLTDQRSRDAIEAAERSCDGTETNEELEAARVAARMAAALLASAAVIAKRVAALWNPYERCADSDAARWAAAEAVARWAAARCAAQCAGGKYGFAARWADVARLNLQTCEVQS